MAKKWTDYSPDCPGPCMVLYDETNGIPAYKIHKHGLLFTAYTTDNPEKRLGEYVTLEFAKDAVEFHLGCLPDDTRMKMENVDRVIR